MAEISGFFDSFNGDRRYRAERFARYFGRFIKNGYFPDSDISLKVFENDGMTTLLKVGAAYINGYDYEATNDIVKTHDIADGVLNRIDRIVLELNFANREILSKIKKGIPSSSPVAPELQRDADIYELGIADIYIGAGATEITQSHITDQRGNGALCGTVNNLFAMQSVHASAVLVNDANRNYDSHNLEAVLDELKRPLNTYREELDLTTNIFKVVKLKRVNGTLHQKKTLSALVGGYYTVQTIEFYDITGTTVIKTEVYDVTWDSNGNPTSVVKR
ncbi:hypothetical protein MKY34_16710 [Sporosarcina sp. FSL K6-1522]|uniref:hypothetical protein n=1 Tax=Sporosarcina sp. FSL K6-1522 TaxID=2921554 RepID=UPI00315995F0